MATMKYRLSIVFLFSLIIVFLFSIFGPFNYTVFSESGILYLLFCSTLFFCGLSIRGVKIRRGPRKKEYRHYVLTKQGQTVIVFLAFVVIVAAFTHLFRVARLNLGSFAFAEGDFRAAITENRDNFSRLTELLMHLSAPVYLVARSSDNKFSKKSNVVINTAFWIVPLVYLGEGARWSIFFHIVLFFTFRRCRWQKKSVSGKKLVGGIVLSIALLYVLSLVFNLFVVRGSYTADRLQFFDRGDVTLKTWADTLYKTNPTFYNPIWKIFNYFGQSVSIFSYVFKNYDPAYPKTFGLNNLNVIQYLLIPFGYSTAEYKKLVLGMPGAGYYSSFVTGYILDFGIYFAPLMIFITGVLFRTVEKNYNTSLFARNLYYLLVPMCLVAPIYNMWQVGSVNIDIFLLLILTWSFKHITIGDARMIEYQIVDT